MRPYQILLYYCYSPIADPEQFREAHHLFCLEHRLLGRIIVASEGINGTVSGLVSDCDRYISHLWADPRFPTYEVRLRGEAAAVCNPVRTAARCDGRPVETAGPGRPARD